MAAYDCEVEELVALIKSLECGGLDVLIRPKDERLYRLIGSLNKPYLTLIGGGIRLCEPSIACNQIPTNDINIMAAALHLICFGNHEFVVRKTTPPRPNSYLLRNAGALTLSTVIMDRDRKWVQDAVVGDESVGVFVGASACP